MEQIAQSLFAMEGRTSIQKYVVGTGTVQICLEISHVAATVAGKMKIVKQQFAKRSVLKKTHIVVHQTPVHASKVGRALCVIFQSAIQNVYLVVNVFLQTNVIVFWVTLEIIVNITLYTEQFTTIIQKITNVGDNAIGNMIVQNLLRDATMEFVTKENVFAICLTINQIGVIWIVPTTRVLENLLLTRTSAQRTVHVYIGVIVTVVWNGTVMNVKPQFVSIA